MRCELTFEQYAKGNNQLQDLRNHFKLKNNLIDHLWAMKGNNVVAI
jgi:hypothetical protein